MQMMVSFAGAAIGSMVGQPQLGWMIGTAVGTLLFPPEQAKNSGRLEDLKVSASSYGKGIPIAFARMRCSANMIWSTDMEEGPGEGKKGKGDKGSKKGMPETFRYWGNFAMGLCEGPINRVLRVWADGREIWRADGVTVAEEFESTDEWVIEQRDKGWPMRSHMRFYLGTEDQLPDHLIVQHEGADRTPAHRGLAYIVFDRIPLEEFGNRTPTINVEVERILDGASTRPIVTLTSKTFDQQIGMYDFNSDGDELTGPTFAAFHSWVDRVGRVICVPQTIDNADSPRGAETIVRRFQLDKMTELPSWKESIWSRHWTAGFPATAFTTLGSTDRFLTSSIIGGVSTGEMLASVWPVAEPLDPKRTEALALIDGSTGAVKKLLRLDEESNVAGAHMLVGLETKDARYWCAYGHTMPSPSNPFPAPSPLANAITIGHFGKAGDPDLVVLLDETLDAVGRNVWSVVAIPGTSPRFVVVALDNWNAGIVSFMSISIGEDGTLTKGAWVDTPTTIANLRITSAVNVGLDRIVVFGNTAAPMTSHAMVFSSTTFAMLWREKYLDAIDPVFLNASDPVMGTEVAWVSMNNYLRRLDVMDRTIHAYPGILQGQQSVSGLKQTYLEGVRMIAAFHGNAFAGELHPGYGAITETGTTGTEGNLDDILIEIASRVGVAVEDISVTGLGAETVDGYLIEAPRAGRDIVGELGKAYSFDIAEVDGKVTFRSRDRAPIRTINESDFALLTEDDDQREEYRVKREQIWEAPARVTVSYVNRDRDYHVGTEASPRNTNPVPTVPNLGNLEVNFPIALTSKRAKLMSWHYLKAIWSERETLEWRLPWTHIDLDPTDIVVLNLNDGTSQRERILKSDLGADMTLDMAAVNHSLGTWTDTPPNLEVDVPPRVGTPKPKLVAPVPFLLDLPLLDDSHDPGAGKMIHYVWLGQEREGAVNAGILKAWNAEATTTVGKASATTEWGFVLGEMPAPANGWWGTDRKSRIELMPVASYPELWTSADSEEAFHGGQNAVLIGEELIYFRDVEWNDDGSVTLTHLLRGRRGTEWAIDKHAYGDRFIVPSLRDPVPITPIDALTRQGSTLRIDVLYQASAGSGEVSATIKSRANSRRPWAPVHLTCVAQEMGLQFAWKRRSRLSSPLRDWTDSVPLEEESERFLIYVLHEPGDLAFDPDVASSYRKVLEATGPAFWLPDGAPMDEAGISLGEPFEVAICQFSTVCGRGFFARKTFTL